MVDNFTVDSFETIPSIADQIAKCPQCGQFKRLRDDYCLYCGAPAPFTTPIAKDDTVRQSMLPLDVSRRAGNVQFGVGCAVILQTMNSAAALHVSPPASGPVVLGRKVLPGGDALLDLTEFNAFQHGVSRRHCQLERQQNRLLVTDLGSSNGTYLNGDPLFPYTQYTVADGDFLTVAALRFRVLFDCAQEMN